MTVVSTWFNAVKESVTRLINSLKMKCALAIFSIWTDFQNSYSSARKTLRYKHLHYYYRKGRTAGIIEVPMDARIISHDSLIAQLYIVCTAKQP